jgi:prepilin-type N-terminal cleavage/methylation domain-containing protein
MDRQRGQTLLELMVVLGVITIFSMIGIYAADAGMRQASLLGGTSELRAVFHEARMLAVARDRNVGIKFRDVGDTWTWTVYEDGDGDGILNDDIKKKVDRELLRTRRFDHRPAAIAVPPYDVPDPLKPGALLGTRAAVRFGNSTLCSFSRQGEATNGSIVLTDGRRATIIRVHGTTGRIDVYRWDGKRWRVGE